VAITNRVHRERVSKETRAFVLQRDGYRCAVCRERKPAFYLTADHIKPSAHGGTGLISNLRCVCKRCNSSRGAPHPIEGKYR
jgi:5-methylcytosine-specific restriction endonuclease McrA